MTIKILSDEYFSKRRHNYIDLFDLCQTYAKISKRLIRDNAIFLVSFKTDDINLKHVFSDNYGKDKMFDKFKKLCSLCYNGEYGFLCMTVK